MTFVSLAADLGRAGLACSVHDASLNKTIRRNGIHSALTQIHIEFKWTVRQGLDDREQIISKRLKISI
jgi:hypothetical protein